MNKKILQIAVFSILTLSSLLLFIAFYNKKNPEAVMESSNKYLLQKSDNLKITKIAVISDTHLNEESFKFLLGFLNSNPVAAIIHLGDHTDFGDLKSLKLSKSYLDSLNVTYYSLAGDHDIAETSSLSNFSQVYKTTKYMTINDINLTFINNPFNYTPFSTLEFDEILRSISNADLILTSQPLFVPKDNFFSYKYMGSMDDVANLSPTKQISLKEYNSQGQTLLSKIRETQKQLLIVSGDHHRSATFTDPANSLITYHITGALAKNIYLGSKQYSQKALQSPRFSIIEIYKNSEGQTQFKIKEQIIEN